ncbi:MAG: histidine--tRNA ligase family protein [Chloroflexi bacterium]|nr:histidine--tRNA ligase family protein [Chloroflexota bacterium]
MNDALPPDDARLRGLTHRLRHHFERFGYRGIDTPILENLDLFLRKSGEEIAARMYSFTHWNRKLCLRPELTASVMRAYVSQLRDRPLPVRVHYAGPTFRYEKPQRGRYRQFTQVGIECIGGEGPSADAEVLAAACGAVAQIGLRNSRLVVGHLGVVLQLLEQLGIDEHGQNLILGNMEALARRGADPDEVVPRVLALMGVGSTVAQEDRTVDEADEEPASLLPSLLSEFGSEGAAHVASDLLARANLVLEGGSRTPEEIVSRLVSKAGRLDPTDNVSRAVDFIVQLQRLAGPPSEAFERIAALLAEHNLDPGPLREIERALSLLPSYGVEHPDVVVDLSLGRGLRFYTGLVFELHATAVGGVSSQIGGGGRYDDLVRSLGGHDAIPACGFSFGLERLKLALEAEGAELEGDRPLDVVVAPIEEGDEPLAVQAATRLRADGLDVEVDLRRRGVKANLRHADREGIPYVVIVGERERQAGQPLLRDMRSRSEQAVDLDRLVQVVRAGR